GPRDGLALVAKIDGAAARISVSDADGVRTVPSPNWPRGHGGPERSALLLRAHFLPEVLLEPPEPPALHVALADRIVRTVPDDRIRDELRRDAVVDQRVIQLVGLHRRHAVVAGIGHD